MKHCKDCEKLSDMLYAANQREGKLIVELANKNRELELAISKALQAESKVQGS